MSQATEPFTRSVSSPNLKDNLSRMNEVKADSRTPVPIVYYNNYGTGVSNHIVGTQNNFNGLTTIIQYARNSPSHEYIHADSDVIQITRSPALEPFFNAIGHLNVLCDFLASHHNHGSVAKLPISFVFDSLPQIRDHLSFAAKAFGLLITSFPEITKSFRYFKQFEAFVQRCAIPLSCLRSLVQSSKAASIQQDLVLYYLSANHNWLDTAESFLDAARPELECFLQIVSSRWIERLENKDATVSMQLMTLGDEIRRHCHPTYRHLRFDCFFLKDHLGNQVPIPHTMPQELDTIIRRLCAGLSGVEYIMNDLWELVCANDTQVVNRSNVTVSQAILPELVYEISIILQVLGASGSRCPQCKSANLERADNDWRACSDCGAKSTISLLPGPASATLDSEEVVSPSHPSHKSSPPNRLSSFLSKARPAWLPKGRKRNKSSKATLPTSASSLGNATPSAPNTTSTTGPSHEMQSIGKFQRITIHAVPHFSLERTEEFLLDIAHRKTAFKEPPAGLDRRKRVLLLAKEHVAKPYRSGGTRLAKRKRPYSLTELLHLVESLEHHFPHQHFDLRLPRIVASLGNSEVCPRSFPHGPELSDYVDHIIWGLDITTPTLMSTSNRKFRQWSPFGVSNANISVPYETSWTFVSSSAIHPSGEYVALGYENGDVAVFEAFTGTLISTMTGHNNHILSLTFSPVDPLLASAASTVIKIWDLRTGEECTTSSFRHPNRVSTVAFSPDGKRLGSISVDDSFRVWNISNGEVMHYHDGSNTVVWSPDGRYLAHVYLGEPQPGVFCVIRDAATCELVASRPMEHDVDCMAFSPNGKQLAVGLEKTVLVMDVESLRDLARFHLARTRSQNRMEFATDLAFSSDGQYLAVLAEYGEVSVWAV